MTWKAIMISSGNTELDVNIFMRFAKTVAIIFSHFAFISALGQTMQTNSLGQITNITEAKFNRVIEEVRIYGGDNKIPFSSITGSRFWQDEWQQAGLYINSKLLGIIPVKLNLVTSEIHVLMNNEEKVITNDISSVIFFKENDTSISTAAFIRHVPNLFLDNKKLDDFVQVLNYGNYQLLKYIARKVSFGDSLFHTLKRYYFSDDNFYFLKSGNKVERIKKLNKEAVLAFLRSSSSFTDWIEANNINFKKENDVIRFLNYYNSQKQQ